MVGHAQKFFRRRRRRRRPPRKIPTAKLPRIGICYSRNVRLSLGFRKMVRFFGGIFQKEVWDVLFGDQKTIKMRLVDILVDFSGNPAFQKYRGTSLPHFLNIIWPKNKTNKCYRGMLKIRISGRKLIHEYSL